MLQTYATDLDTLAEQVAHREAWREATDKRILKTKKKEDNHITYHECGNFGGVPWGCHGNWLGDGVTLEPACHLGKGQCYCLGRSSGGYQ